jgi:hypothetical protein
LKELFQRRLLRYPDPGNRLRARYLMLVGADRSTDFEHVQRLLMMASFHGGVTKVLFAAEKER